MEKLYGERPAGLIRRLRSAIDQVKNLDKNDRLYIIQNRASILEDILNEATDFLNTPNVLEAIVRSPFHEGELETWRDRAEAVYFKKYRRTDVTPPSDPFSQGNRVSSSINKAGKILATAIRKTTEHVLSATRQALAFGKVSLWLALVKYLGPRGPPRMFFRKVYQSFSAISDRVIPKVTLSLRGAKRRGNLNKLRDYFAESARNEPIFSPSPQIVAVGVVLTGILLIAFFINYALIGIRLGRWPTMTDLQQVARENEKTFISTRGFDFNRIY